MPPVAVHCRDAVAEDPSLKVATAVKRLEPEIGSVVASGLTATLTTAVFGRPRPFPFPVRDRESELVDVSVAVNWTA
jgi:hypothetical protein